MRAHHGLAWFPFFSEAGETRWEPNPTYSSSQLVCKKASHYPELDLSSDIPIYEQFCLSPASVQWVSDPARFSVLWPHFQP